MATWPELDVWALFSNLPPLQTGAEVKIVWRAGGDGEFTVVAVSERGGELAPSMGPTGHEESNWDRPGDEWGTAFVFPEPGCWTSRSAAAPARPNCG